MAVGGTGLAEFVIGATAFRGRGRRIEGIRRGGPTMPNGRQNQARGGQQGAGGEDQGMGQRLREGASQVGDRMREGYDTAREAFSHSYRRTEGMIARNPAPSVFVAFGVGLGLGVLLSVA